MAAKSMNGYAFYVLLQYPLPPADDPRDETSKQNHRVTAK
jgi:hypothetical protein